MGNTTKIFQSDEYIYEMCHLIHDKTFTRPDPINNLASILIKTDEIKGNAILIKTKITDNKTCVPDRLNLYELTNIVRTKFVHQGIVVSKDICSYEYIVNPVEVLSEKEVKNIRSIEIPYLKFIICFFIEVEPTINEINKYITMIITNNIIKGRVFVSLENLEKTEYLNLSVKLFKELVAIMSDETFISQLTQQEDVENGEIDGKQTILNCYSVIHLRYLDFIKRNGEIEFKEGNLENRKNIHDLMKEKK
jgi:hypothetical protein